ncbi:alpha/beta fold hydrolase [Rhizobacter sp. OV335]|uniref:alpha/beta fold hydrolase n=1 Tax=Rhizobacter sp. OV335 TaxID=1500264 RepID=UPI000936A192|nr:alpha/beta hydrolase [Rhizobacter sp. OV335]
MTTPIPLLLLPGLMNDGRVWEPIRRSMPAGRNFIVAATHMADTIEASAAAAVQAMPPGMFGVAGFSLGGYVALEVCRQASGRIAGLALLDTGARADSVEAVQNRKRMVAALASGSASFAQIASTFAPRLLHESHARDSQLIDLLADMARTVGSEGFVRQQTAAMNRSDSRDVLRTLRCPALVLCGRDDQVAPPALSEEMANLLTGSVELAVIDRCGHMSPLEQPDAVAEAFARWTGRVDSNMLLPGSR